MSIASLIALISSARAFSRKAFCFSMPAHCSFIVFLELLCIGKLFFGILQGMFAFRELQSNGANALLLLHNRLLVDADFLLLGRFHFVEGLEVALLLFLHLLEIF